MADSPLNRVHPDKSADTENLLPDREYKLYRYRYVIALLYAGVSIVNQMFWVTTSTLTTQIVDIYGISLFAVNMTSLVYLFLYVPANFPSNWLLDQWGLRPGIVLGAALTLIGAWVRVGAGVSYTFVIIGQLIGACGQPLILNAPQKISATWFPPESRALVTTLLSVTAPVGVAFGFVVPGFIIPEDLGKEDGKQTIRSLMILEGIIASVALVPAIIFFRSKPPSPPSASSKVKKPKYIESLKKTLSDKNYWYLVIGGGLTISTSATIATVSQQLLNPFGFTQHQVTVFGAVMIPSGLVGSIFFMFIIKKKKCFKKVLCLTVILGTVCFVLTGLAIASRNFWLVLIGIAMLGFTAAPAQPISLEFACELTFPAGEATAGGFIISIGQFASAVEIVIMDTVLAKTPSFSGSVYSGILMTSLLVLAIICTLRIKERLVRSEHEEKNTRNGTANNSEYKEYDQGTDLGQKPDSKLVINPHESP